MTTPSRKFLLDANVLITAHRSYYAFDLCPGFWQSLQRGFSNGHVCSTQRVKAELLHNADALADWINDSLPADFFVNDSTAAVTAAYRPLMSWVMGRNFLPAAQNKFATDADGWLVATAKAEGFCVVTHEQRQPAAKARVMIPDLCDEFGIDVCNTFQMLRDLGCAYS